MSLSRHGQGEANDDESASGAPKWQVKEIHSGGDDQLHFMP